MKVNTHDYRQNVESCGERPKGFFICLCTDKTVLYEWAEFDNCGQKPKTSSPILKDWPALLNFCRENALFESLDCTALFRPYGSNDLIIDDSRDSYKWSAARTVYSPETKPALLALLDRGLIDLQTNVFFGNWALADGLLEGTVGDILGRDTQKLVLYHGTSSHRLKSIRKRGLRPTPEVDRVWPRPKRHKTPAVFLSGSLERALYFTRETVKHDKAALIKAGKREEAKLVSHAIVRVELDRNTPCIVDDDWIDSPNFKEGTWETSLMEFGQVGVLKGIDRSCLSTPSLVYRHGSQNFHLGVTALAEL